MLKRLALWGGLIAFGAAIGPWLKLDNAIAQLSPAPGGIKRTILQKVEVPGSNYEVIMGMAEVPAGTASIGRHTHFGVEAGSVIEGESILIVDGQPEKAIKPGDSYQIPAAVPHDAKTGDKPAKIVAIYVVEKGKPLATPAPK